MHAYILYFHCDFTVCKAAVTAGCNISKYNRGLIDMFKRTISEDILMMEEIRVNYYHSVHHDGSKWML